MAKRYELTGEQWRRIEGLLPGKSGDPGRSGRDNRVFVNGVLWILRSGAHWHDLPERYGKWKTAHQRFRRWAKAGVWERVFADLIHDPGIDQIRIRTSQGGTGVRFGRPTSTEEFHHVSCVFQESR